VSKDSEGVFQQPARGESFGSNSMQVKTSQIWFTQKVLLPSGGRTSKALATEPMVL